jgi:hypothetical protein
MAIGLIFDGLVTQDQYEQVLNEVSSGGVMAPGMRYHAAGPSENGWCVIEVWESKEAAEQFLTERLGQALQKAGITVQPKLFGVHNLLQA